MSPFDGIAAVCRSVVGVKGRGRSARGGRPRSAAASLEALEVRTLMTASHGMRGMAAGGAMNPEVIEALAAEAYVWGLAPEFAQRFSTYNTILSVPFNQLEYGTTPAAWNNDATNAGDASVVYINGFTDFTKAPALVLTVPPSSDQYYVVNYLDDYLNTIGSIGTRTTPSDEPTSYLLVGPNSPYARRQTVTIRGFEYRVMASDTNVNWMLIRIGTNTLADASDPQSVPNVQANVVQKFALNTLDEFEKNGHQPAFPTNYDAGSSPTPEQVERAAPYQNTPTNAVEFLNQLGQSVRKNPIPSRTTALSGTPLRRLPAWVVPQYGAKDRYMVPSFGQQGILKLLGPIGLSKNGYRVPRNWGPAQLEALQAGFEAGQQRLDAFISSQAATSSTNYWTILNTIIGTYPNNEFGYLLRSTIVLNGGSANVPADAVYPAMASYQGTTPLDGNETYTITFTPPQAGQPLPAVGILPPLVTDAQGDPEGFWSITLYQPDPTEVAAPFLSQASVLNTAYSTADTAVVSVDAATDVLTVAAPSWGNIIASTPILFGANAAEYGLSPNTVYYVAAAPTSTTDPTTGQTTYSFPISTQWLQTLSAGNVPIQDSGAAGAIVDLASPAGASPLTYGMVKPVSQLGSMQLTAGQMQRNADGSVTIGIGPTLPAGVAATNWIPTPSTAYFNALYPGATVSTALQLIMRMYYPTPGNTPPSILPYDSGSTRLPESYIPPAVVKVS
ncbi:DUF1254 domain-containing protein [Paludisphaera soli]|uniref:DUF1254 domain-containing protein n=1 Tax=Paludisphaera soli TaxID=2712865 RepID=UPI0013EE0EAB|nr:DUF1254 domain-containing protein [Paludisphaera soli]